MILAQIDPVDANEHFLFTAKARTDISMLKVCNRTAGALGVRVRVTAPGEEAVNNKQYILYGKQVAANFTDDVKLGPLMAGESIYVLTSAINVNFVLFGEERP